MTTEEFLHLQDTVARPIAPSDKIDEWVEAVLAGEPRDDESAR
jgi:hypothetical protein